MPVTSVRVRRHVLSSVITSALILVACPPVRAQSPATVAASPSQPLPATSAVLIVEPPAPGAPESDAQWQRRIQTHVASIASEHNLRRALTNEDGEVRKTHWFQTSNDPAERAAWLRDHLHVRAVPGTSLIELALPDVKDAAERQTLLVRAANAYLAFHIQSGDTSAGDRARVLARLQDKAKSRLATLAVEEQKELSQLNATGGGGIGRVGAKEVELSRLVGEQIDASVKAQKATANYQAADAALREGRDPGDVDEYVRRLAPFLANDDAQLEQMQVEAELARQQLGPESPRYKTFAKRLDLMREANAKKHDDARAKARAALVEELKSDAETAKGRLEAVNRRVETAKAEMADLKSAALALTALQKEQKGLRDQLQQIRSQLEQSAASRPTPSAPDIHWYFQPEAVPAR